MGEKRIEVVTESMFYTLMAFLHGEMSGNEVSSFVEEQTGGRVRLGPATLYTILGRFETEGVLRETKTEGRRRFYVLADKGREMYRGELMRMEQCIADAKCHENGGSKK